MPRLHSIFLQCLTYCLLFGLTYALDGATVIPVKSHKFPFVVSLSSRSFSHKFVHLHFCTGTLVHPKKILTTAYCLARKRPDEIEIIAGSMKLEQGQKYYPESWTTFDQWNPHHGNRNLTRNNIAIIKLKGDGITGIPPASLFRRDTVRRDNRIFVITGWGETFKGRKIKNLRRGHVLILSNEECSEKSADLKGDHFVLPSNYFCSKGDTSPVLVTCGDGGAPIFNKEEKLVGINVGTCPNVDGYLFNSEEFLREHKMNAHVDTFYYIDFILNA